MASGLNFKSLNDTVTTDINLYPEIKDNSDFISLGTLLEKVASNNKIGKYASQTKEVTMSYVVPESSDTYNIKYQTAVYMYDIINFAFIPRILGRCDQMQAAKKIEENFKNMMVYTLNSHNHLSYTNLNFYL